MTYTRVPLLGRLSAGFTSFYDVEPVSGAITTCLTVWTKIKEESQRQSEHRWYEEIIPDC